MLGGAVNKCRKFGKVRDNHRQRRAAAPELRRARIPHDMMDDMIHDLMNDMYGGRYDSRSDERYDDRHVERHYRAVYSFMYYKYI